MKEKIHVIVPMRKGSQRVRAKNVRLIQGKPLYEYILTTLLKIKGVDKIILNTDIPAVMRKYRGRKKFIILKREGPLRGNCDINRVIEKTLQKIDGKHFLQTHATNPLIRADTLKAAIKTYFNHPGRCDSLFSVTRLQKRFWNQKGIALNHSLLDPPTTQNVEPYFEENSCFYIFSRSSFMKNKNRIGGKPYLFETDLMESIDVDTPEDLKMVERLLKK